LDDGQRQAVAVIASGVRLAVVGGAAGAGKTTMLATAAQAAGLAGRGMATVAPTLKAAKVAGREIGANSSSVHQIAYDRLLALTRDTLAAGNPRKHNAPDTEPDDQWFEFDGQRYSLSVDDDPYQYQSPRQTGDRGLGR